MPAPPNALEEDVNNVVILLREISEGNRDAFKEFYFHYSPRIGRFLMKTLKSHERVEEVMNDVMLTIWQSAGKFDPEKGKFTTWLFGIAHNKALKSLERDRRYSMERPIHEEDEDYSNTLEDGPDAPRDNTTPEITVLGWELGSLLEWALDRLSIEHRTVLELAFSEGQSYQEIAEIMNCPTNTIKTRVFHAKKRLHELLSKRGYSPTLMAQETIA